MQIASVVINIHIIWLIHVLRKVIHVLRNILVAEIYDKLLNISRMATLFVNRLTCNLLVKQVYKMQYEVGRNLLISL